MMAAAKLVEQAQAWYKEHGKDMRPITTSEGRADYDAWAAWAFSNLSGLDKLREKEKLAVLEVHLAIMP